MMIKRVAVWLPFFLFEKILLDKSKENNMD